MAMYAALTRLMTGPAPEVGSGERRESPAPGYATFDNLLTAIGQLQTTIRDEMRALGLQLGAENAATRHLVEAYRQETDARLDALEAQARQEELEEAFARGRWAVIVLAFRWLTDHYQVVWALVALVLGILWTVTGTPAVGVGPVQSQP